MEQRIKQAIEDSINLKTQLLNDPSALSFISKISDLICSSINNDGKVLTCGNGGSAADAQHVAAELVGRFMKNRKALPAIALTTDTSILTAVGNDYGFEYVFSRQVDALCNPQDIVIGLSTSGNSNNIIEAFKSAKSKGATIVALLGGDGGECAKYADYSYIVPSKESGRIQEVHLLIEHLICELVETKMFSKKNKAVFLDRDGTINVDFNFVYRVEDLVFIPNVIEALKIFRDAGYLLIVVTNQSGVDRGHYTMKDVDIFHKALSDQLAAEGIEILEYNVCPHLAGANCCCRKPSPHFINEAILKYNIDPKQSFMFGDKVSDIECGENAKVRSFFITKEHSLHYWAQKLINNE